jgi:LuxR family maltose regulon positive regulatory protein
LDLAADQGGSVPPTTADLYVGFSEVRHEQNDLDAAARYLRSSKEFGEHGGLPENRYRWYVGMARIEETQGDLDRALDLLDEAQRLYVRSPDPEVRPVAAVKARVWVRQGRLVEALGWAHDRRLSVDDELSYLREFEHITLARLLMARDRHDRGESDPWETMALLDRLQQAAEKGGRLGSLIEVLVLQALAQEAQGDVIRALSPLQRALTLAEPEGYVRTFVDEGEAVRALLRHAAADGPASAYARQLLSAFEKPARPASSPPHGVSAGLVEPLSRREVEILRLIATGLRNQDIADQLCISVSTVKRHIANTYGKLGVSHRTEAILRANEHKLL